jgi:hypothetical protein
MLSNKTNSNKKKLQPNFKDKKWKMGEFEKEY